jgi:hypothetical protein
VSTAAWLSLVFLLVAAVASVSLAAFRGLRLWRSFRSFSDLAETALDDVMRNAAVAEERANSLTKNQERLTRAVAHLQASLAQLAVLRAAANETRAGFDRLRGIVPSK